MNLDTLRTRKSDLDNSAVQLQNNWQIIQGHKAEVDYWISEFEKLETKVDETLVTELQVPVE